MYRILVRLIEALLRGLFALVWMLIPWVLVLLRSMLLLAITSLASLHVGVPTAVNRMSDSWTEEATNRGIPLGYNPKFRSGARVVAVVTLVLGWLVLGLLALWIISLLF
jgi:hypothetical protein